MVNHTSTEHEWFRTFRRREDGYEDDYIWRDGTPENPPNNRESIFGGSAWSDGAREQRYLHLFHEEQPDLNWRTPAVRADVAEMISGGGGLADPVTERWPSRVEPVASSDSRLSR